MFQSQKVDLKYYMEKPQLTLCINYLKTTRTRRPQNLLCRSWEGSVKKIS